VVLSRRESLSGIRNTRIRARSASVPEFAIFCTDRLAVYAGSKHEALRICMCLFWPLMMQDAQGFHLDG
jgi:hypothetical protein